MWHREPKRSGRATRAVCANAKKEGSFGPPPRRKPTALCFSRTSRDPDACSEARLGSTCFGSSSSSLSCCPLSIARTRHCVPSSDMVNPSSGTTSTASRKPGKTCQHTVTWRYSLPLLSPSQSAASPLFLTGQGTLNLLGRRGEEYSRRAPRQLLFSWARLYVTSFLITLFSSWDKQSAPTLPCLSPIPPFFRPTDIVPGRLAASAGHGFEKG